MLAVAVSGNWIIRSKRLVQNYVLCNAVFVPRDGNVFVLTEECVCVISEDDVSVLEMSMP